MVPVAVCAGLVWFGWHAQPGAQVARTFWRAGSPRAEWSLRGEVRHGPSRTWHSNGQLESSGAYDGGERSGEWNFWNVDGTPDGERSGTYADGRLTSS